MTRSVDRIENVLEIFKIKNTIFYFDSNLNKILQLKESGELSINRSSRYSYDANFIYLIEEKKILVLTSKFEEVFNVLNNDIQIEGSSMTLFKNGNYFLINHFFDKRERKLISNYIVSFSKKKISQQDFFGKILNQNFKLNFLEGIYKNPSYFHCSDLLDRETYWEYDCGEGYRADRFYIWRENLVFVKGGEKGAILIVKELKTGKIIWESEIPHGAFNFDEERGLLVSVWGNKFAGNNYQIINLNLNSIVSGKIEANTNFANVNVHWQQQFLHNNRLFFSDNVYSSQSDIKPIKFGSFNIETKKIEFIQEIPEPPFSVISQIIYHDKKLYIRLASNELLIFEDEQIS